MYQFGFIGVGNMGGALAAAVCKNCEPSAVCLSNRTREKAEALAEKLGCRTGTNGEAADSDYVFLGVKPQTLPELFSELAPVLKRNFERGRRCILVTMAAGVTMEAVEKMSGVPSPVIRIMPNTPLAVGEGMILYTANAAVTEKELSRFAAALEGTGRMDWLEEAEIDAASVLSGCGPAFAFLFADALSRAGQELGLSPEKARLYAEQMLLGSSRLALESGKDLKELARAVCSPSGTTIEGVKRFEEEGLNAIVSHAVKASYRRTLELAGKDPDGI